MCENVTLLCVSFHISLCEHNQNPTVAINCNYIEFSEHLIRKICHDLTNLKQPFKMAW